MTKQETYDYLRARGAAFEITEHKAVYNMEECADLELPYPESDAKNLFVRDDKRCSYYLITVRGDKRVDLKAFHPNDNTATVWMWTDDLLRILREHGTSVELTQL